jgi:hypothetical protein
MMMMMMMMKMINMNVQVLIQVGSIHSQCEQNISKYQSSVRSSTVQ